MKTLIIIPAYNEEESIENTIGSLQRTNSNIDYVIINDCSTDKTREICKKNNYNVINLPVNLGIGGAVQTGYKFASEYNYDIAIQLDADGQHDPKYINEMIKEIENGNDLVIGSRFLKKEGFQSTWIRRMGINLYSKIIKIFTKIDIKDTTSGYRAVSKKIIKIFSKEYPIDYPEPETDALIAKNGFKVKEIPMEMKERDGRSKFYYSIKINLLCNKSRTSSCPCLYNKEKGGVEIE